MIDVLRCHLNPVVNKESPGWERQGAITLPTKERKKKRKERDKGDVQKQEGKSGPPKNG